MLLHAAAHITGGGLIDNLPRVLPKGTQANIRRDSWKIPALFQIIEAGGKVDALEMYQVFNMGIGMVLIVDKKRQTETVKLTRGKVIGEIVEGNQTVAIV